MPTATMTSKGQLTIPLEMRKELGLKPGDQIIFAKNPQGRYVLYPRNGSVQQLKGILGNFDRIVTIDEMRESVAQGIAQKLGLEEVETV